MPVELISANHAAALAATLSGRANRNGRGFCSGVYPITPSTECMEYLSLQKIEKGKVIRVESEHSAMGVCIGAASAGARSFSTTSSNGLAYMAENCISASFFRLPVVLAVANRTLGPPWNIFADQGDSLMLRDMGWLQLYCADNQEVFDTVLAAFRLAEDQRVMMPAMVCMEGFILSHTMAQTDIPEQDQVDLFLPTLDVPHRLGTVPHSLGEVMEASQTAVHRMQQHETMLEVPRVYQEVRTAFEQNFNRPLPDVVVPYRADDAEALIVSMGTISVTVERVVDVARERGEKVGALRVRMFRPLPEQEIKKWFQGRKKIAVIDRNISLGSGGILWGEVRGLAEPQTAVQGYMAGVGGGDVRPGHIENMLLDLEKRQRGDLPVMMETL